jgi:hypothetical protein
VPRGDPYPGPGTDAAPGTDARPPPGTDAGPPRAHWGWLLIQDHETVGDGIFARFYDRAAVPLPESLLEGAATAVAGAPGCFVNPLDAYPTGGVDAGPLSLTGLAGPSTLEFSAGGYDWTSSGLGFDTFTGATWGFSGGGGSDEVAAFAGTDEPPDVLSLTSSVYSPGTRTYAASWVPGNGTVMGVVAVSPGAEVVCLTDDAAGAGALPAAAVNAVTPPDTDPVYVGALRMRVIRHGDPDAPAGTVVFSIGKSGYLAPP